MDGVDNLWGGILENVLFWNLIVGNDLEVDPNLNDWNKCNFWNSDQIIDVYSSAKSDEYFWFFEVCQIIQIRKFVKFVVTLKITEKVYTKIVSNP